LQINIPFCVSAHDNIRFSRCVCLFCYEKYGGHIHERPGRGRQPVDCVKEKMHENDLNISIKAIVDWLLHLQKADD
jgi:hypothetical protein